MTMGAITPLPVDTPWGSIDLAVHSLTGWPRHGACPHCGAAAVMLVATRDNASYECRGTPTDSHSAYGPDRCGRVFDVNRGHVPFGSRERALDECQDEPAETDWR